MEIVPIKEIVLNYSKVIIVCVFGLLGLVSCSNQEKIVRREVVFDQAEPGVARMMTFNIRYGAADDGKNSWLYRRNMVFDVLAYHEADVIGLQEALEFQIQQIKRALPQYAVVWAGRDDGQKAGEACPILYRRDHFTLVDSGTFWFSNMPWKPGSRHWGNELPRVCTWVYLTETATGQSFYVYNLHLDPASQPSRQYSVNLLAKELAARKPADPAVVMGDFNMDTDNPAMAPLGQIGADLLNDPMVDVWSYLHPDQPSVTTFQAFGTQPQGPCLDHIFINASVGIIEAAVDARMFDGRCPSDHFPVIATLQFETE